MIKIDETLLIQMLNFLVLMWILNRFLFRPILNILEERKKRIRDNEERVRDSEQRAAQQWEAYERQLQEAKVAGAAEKERIKGEGLEAERHLLEEARSEASRSLEEARRNIAEEVSRAGGFLRKEADGMALEMAEKILGRGLR